MRRIHKNRAVMWLYGCAYEALYMPKTYNSRREYDKYSQGASEEERRKGRFVRNAFLYGVGAEDYFVLGFQKRTPAQKRTYLTVAKGTYLHQRCNDPAAAAVLGDKARFYEVYRPYLGREVLAVNGPEEREAFMDLCRRRGQLIVKPRDQDCGTGVRKAQVDTEEQREALWQEALAGRLLVEEVMENHPVVAAFHPPSLNSVRVCTVAGRSGRVRLLGAVLRCGDRGSVVDHPVRGGLYAGVDVETGRVFTDGFDLLGGRHERHPYSQTPFLDTALPNWAALPPLIETAMARVPGLRMVGWDCILKKDGSWALQEGNCPGDTILAQAALGRGFLQKALETVWD